MSEWQPIETAMPDTLNDDLVELAKVGYPYLNMTPDNKWLAELDSGGRWEYVVKDSPAEAIHALRERVRDVK